MSQTPENASDENLDERRDREETYSPIEAGRVLGVSDERVRQLVDSGDLTGEKRKGRWFVFRWSVHDALEERGSPRSRRPRERRLEGSQNAGEWIERVNALEREVGRLEGEIRMRVELTERTESSVRESLDRERQRADRLEDEARTLREKLEESRRSWFSRLFGTGRRAQDD